jgi:alkanesulfonate monooxygenase SsuD/methylene tetrahydromethanopterin reductase-like flavin-dependent oxidoreductase (luciferase family)
MLDLLSHGRMDFAAGGGHPHTRVYECFGVEHEKTHEIMEESLKVIQAAWTEDVIKYEGKFFRIPEVIVNPKPIQKPHPPIYIAASSPDGIELAARLGHNLFLPIHTRAREQVGAFAKSYWENLERNGHDPSRREMGILVPMHLAGTVTEAKKRAQDGIMSYYKTIREMRKNYIEWLTAQGTPLPSRLLKTAIGEFTLEQVCGEYAVIGDSDTAVTELKELSAKTGASHILAWMNIGSAPQKFVLEAMEQFAREVMPQIDAWQPERSSFSTAQAGS